MSDCRCSPPLRSMPSRRWQRVAQAMLGILAAGALVACASPDRAVRLYSLISPNAGAKVDAGRVDSGRSASRSSPIPIALSRIRLPAQVDQPQILVRLDDDSLVALEQQRWASPLRSELREAVLERLIVRYGAVEARDRAESDGQVTDVRIVFRRFESRPDREALIEGSWTLSRDATKQSLTCEWLIREPASGGVPALAQAHRLAVGRLTDQIGQALSGRYLSKCPMQSNPTGSESAAVG